MEAWRQYGGFYRLVDFTTNWTYDTPPIETRTLPTLPAPSGPTTPITPIQTLSTIAGPSLEQPLTSPQDEADPRSSWRHSVLRPMVSLPDYNDNPEESLESDTGSTQGRVGDLDLDEIELGLQREPVINTGNYDHNGLTSYRCGGDDDIGGTGLGLSGLDTETAPDLPRSSRIQSWPQFQPQAQSTAGEEVPTTTVTEPVSTQKGRRQAFRLVKKWFSSVKISLARRKRIGRIYEAENLENGDLSVSTPKRFSLPLPQASRSVSFVYPQEEKQIEEQEQGQGQEQEQEQGQERRCEECDQAQKSGTVDWSRPLALREWKEWGYYARPWINGVFVNNYPPRPDLDPVDISYAEIERLAENLIDEQENEHPEIWIPCVQHPSLPPRPPRWSSDPAPYWSGQCELNPYLRRKLIGEPPLFWDMGKDPSTAVHGHNLVATPLLPPDRAQPATWPMTTHFFISALADDVEFKWPILIRNKHGVTVQDVLEWVYTNFQEAVDCDEWATWPMYLRSIATISYDKRGERDYLKRIDYLGFHSMFRGCEHSPDGQSWYLYVGRPY